MEIAVPDYRLANSYGPENMDFLYDEILEEKREKVAISHSWWQVIIPFLKNILYNHNRVERNIMINLFQNMIYPLLTNETTGAKAGLEFNKAAKIDSILVEAYEELYSEADQSIFLQFVEELAKAMRIEAQTLITQLYFSILKENIRRRVNHRTLNTELACLLNIFQVKPIEPLSEQALKELNSVVKKSEHHEMAAILEIYCRLFKLDPFDLALAWMEQKLSWPETSNHRSAFADLFIRSANENPELGYILIINWIADNNLETHSHLGLKSLRDFLYFYYGEAKGLTFKQ